MAQGLRQTDTRFRCPEAVAGIASPDDTTFPSAPLRHPPAGVYRDRHLTTAPQDRPGCPRTLRRRLRYRARPVPTVASQRQYRPKLLHGKTLADPHRAVGLRPTAGPVIRSTSLSVASATQPHIRPACSDADLWISHVTLLAVVDHLLLLSNGTILTWRISPHVDDLSLIKQSFIEHTLDSRASQRTFSRERLKRYPEHNQCPCNDQLSAEGVWLPQYAFLGGKRLMNDIADAMAKIHDNKDQLAKL